MFGDVVPCGSILPRPTWDMVMGGHQPYYSVIAHISAQAATMQHRQSAAAFPYRLAKEDVFSQLRHHSVCKHLVSVVGGGI